MEGESQGILLLVVVVIVVLVLLLKVGYARLGERDLHPISAKTSAHNTNLLKIIGIALKTSASNTIVKPASHILSNTGSARSFHLDTVSGIKVLRYLEVLPRRGA